MEMPGCPENRDSFPLISFIYKDVEIRVFMKGFNLSKMPHLLYKHLCLQVCIKSYKRGCKSSDKGFCLFLEL